MKRGNVQILGLGLLLALLPLAAGCSPESAFESTAQAADSPPPNELAFTPVPTSGPAVSEPEEASPVSDAPATPISTEKPVPPNIHPTEALSETIRLANSGVDESVLMAYVSNAQGTFSLGSDEIIYLNDIGVPPAVVSAMLQHDHLIIAAATAPPPPAEAQPAPESTAEPVEAPLTPPDSQSSYSAAELPEQPEDVNFDDALAPYGTWVDVEGYGRCWQPSVVVVNPGWRPYCDGGHWLYTDCGWYWFSDYSWGWAPFHYGRWFQHSRLGWCWSPDRVWGPAWVSWRSSSEFCGWAPLPPSAWFRPGFGFTYFGRTVGASFSFGLAANCYTFVPLRNFCDHRLSRCALPRDHVTRIFNNTVVMNNIVYNNHTVINNGIPSARVAAATHTRLYPVAVREAGAPPRPTMRQEQLDPAGRALTVARRHPTPAPRAPLQFGERSSRVVSQPVERTRHSEQGIFLGNQNYAHDSTSATESRGAMPSRPLRIAPVAAASAGAVPSHSQRPDFSSGYRYSHQYAAQPRTGSPLIIHGNGPSQSSTRINSLPSGNYFWSAQRPPATQLHTAPEPEIRRPGPAPAPEQFSRNYSAPSHSYSAESHHYTPTHSMPAFSAPPQESHHQTHVTESHSSPPPASAPAHSSSDHRGR